MKTLIEKVFDDAAKEPVIRGPLTVDDGMWEILKKPSGWVDIKDANRNVIASTYGADHDTNLQCAHQIVTAVNSHAELLSKIAELENPMECGHYGANLQPDDSNNDVCMVCAALALAKGATKP